jgi:hypothetical protein
LHGGHEEENRGRVRGGEGAGGREGGRGEGEVEEGDFSSRMYSLVEPCPVLLLRREGDGGERDRGGGGSLSPMGSCLDLYKGIKSACCCSNNAEK